MHSKSSPPQFQMHRAALRDTLWLYRHENTVKNIQAEMVDPDEVKHR